MSDRPDLERIRDAAEEAVHACLPLLPVVGSDNTGYTVAEMIHPKMIAQPEEWASAAQAIANLHAELAR